MNIASRITRVIADVVVAMALMAGTACAADVRLADNGESRCVIVVPPGAMSREGDTEKLTGPWKVQEAERRRRLVRDSVADLQLYLGKMSGATIEIVEGLPAGERRTPVYIGAEAQQVFGPVGISKADLYGFRVVAGSKGVGLYGESGFGTSYAIYELLHDLGCRWFMPTELGDVVPDSPTVTVPIMDKSLAPATEYRGMTQGGEDYGRRNRLNGIQVACGQLGLENCITTEQLDAHPEWRMVIDGKPIGIFRWTRQDVADAMAENIIKRLDASYSPSISLTPGDYVLAADDPEERKYDPVPRIWEPAAGRWSVTDRLILLANRVAEQVSKKYPDVKFGVLAYVNYSMPPVKQDVHPNVVPVIAPIDFNRHHPMTWPDHPNEYWLRDMVEGWGKKTSRLGTYWYGMNLAELSAPNPFITKWGTDIPILLKNNLTYWGPETMGGWESMMPGYHLAIRMTFHPDEKPEDILNDLYTRFYGAAAEPMGRYWQIMDRAWIDSGEYAGSYFGYLRIFTPEVLANARAEIDAALALCQTALEYRRVKLIDESLTLFELFMKMRQDWADGRLAGLGSDYDIWRSGIRDMVRRYRDPADSTYVQGRHGTLRYPDWQLAGAYRDASRMAREFARLGAPMLEWKWQHNPGPEADALPWTAPDYDDSDWPKTHVIRQTWSTIGHHNTMTDTSAGRSGRMAYRTTQKLGAVPEGKKAYLWIGSTDGSTKLFVNGQHVKYPMPMETDQHEKGDLVDAFSGFCQPGMFDVTATVKPGVNQITILCERTWLNELGSGGLMGPVVMFREK